MDLRRIGMGTNSTLGDQATAVVALERLTLVRLRGSGFIHMDAAAALDSMIIACGIIIVSSEAFTAGVGSVPTPLSDMDRDWVWHSLFVLGPAVVATDDGGDISRNVRFEIDNKAMRKFRTDETLAFVAEGEIVAGAPTADIGMVARQLFKLS